MVGAYPSGFSRSLMGFYGSTRDRCTRRCTGSSSKGGSPRNGEIQRTTGRPNTTASQRLAGSNWMKQPKTGNGWLERSPRYCRLPEQGLVRSELEAIRAALGSWQRCAPCPLCGGYGAFGHPPRHRARLHRRRRSRYLRNNASSSGARAGAVRGIGVCLWRFLMTLCVHRRPVQKRSATMMFVTR